MFHPVPSTKGSRDHPSSSPGYMYSTARPGTWSTENSSCHRTKFHLRVPSSNRDRSEKMTFGGRVDSSIESQGGIPAGYLT